MGIIALLLLSSRVRREQAAGEEVQEAEGGRGPGPPAEVMHEQPLHAQQVGELHSGGGVGGEVLSVRGGEEDTCVRVCVLCVRARTISRTGRAAVGRRMKCGGGTMRWAGKQAGKGIGSP